mmetsp:Transcript_4374/g.6131  ORF Transcript_4374/g.6131 Transcript_4374/m.6131 type:complete len:208 (-) Transcript_4374:51-674(-)
MWAPRIRIRTGVVTRTRANLPRRADDEARGHQQGGVGWKKKQAEAESAPKDTDEIDTLAESLRLGTTFDIKPNFTAEQLAKKKDIDIRIKKWMEESKEAARAEFNLKKNRMRTAFDKLPPRFKAAAQRIDFKMALVPSNYHIPTYDPPKHYPYPPDETDIFEEEKLEEKEEQIRAQRRGRRVKLSPEALKRLQKHRAKRGGRRPGSD